MKFTVAMMLVLISCAGDDTASVRLPENYREQLHAVTGHDPPECTNLRATEAVIEITDNGFFPECAIVSSEQDVSIVNSQAIDDTWIVADPPTDLDLARHARLVFEVGAASTGVIEGIGERVGTGVWVCYGRESRHQCQIVVAP